MGNFDEGLVEVWLFFSEIFGIIVGSCLGCLSFLVLILEIFIIIFLFVFVL